MPDRLPNPWSVPFVTVTVAAGILGLSRSAAYRAVSRGELPTFAGRVAVGHLYGVLGLPIPAPPGTPRVRG